MAMRMQHSKEHCNIPCRAAHAVKCRVQSNISLMPTADSDLVNAQETHALNLCMLMDLANLIVRVFT